VTDVCRLFSRFVAWFDKLTMKDCGNNQWSISRNVNSAIRYTME